MLYSARRRSDDSFCPIQTDMKFIGMTVQFREGKVRSSKRHDGAERLSGYDFISYKLHEQMLRLVDNSRQLIKKRKMVTERRIGNKKENLQIDRIVLSSTNLWCSWKFSLKKREKGLDIKWDFATKKQELGASATGARSIPGFLPL